MNRAGIVFVCSVWLAILCVYQFAVGRVSVPMMRCGLAKRGAAGGRAEKCTSERVRAGGDNEVGLRRWRLTSPKARRLIARAQGSPVLLRKGFSQHPGGPADQIQTSG